MKTALKFSLAFSLLATGSVPSLWGQLQWSAFSTSGALVMENVAAGGDATYGGAVAFTIPANTQRAFVTRTFAPFNVSAAGSSKVITFNVSESGGGWTPSTGRLLGFGIFSSAGTAGSAADDVGYFGLFNRGTPSWECFQRPGNSTTFFQYDSANSFNAGKLNTGSPVDDATYSAQVQVNNANSRIQMGTSSALAGAGYVLDSATVTQQIYATTPKSAAAINQASFDEFAVMFNNTTANPVTLTLSGISLIPLNPGISAPPQSYSGSAGSTASFTVVINTNAQTPLGFQWFETNAAGVVALADGVTAGGSTVSGSVTASTGLFTNTLSFSNVQAADGGSVFVVITNAYGTVTSAPVAMNILAESAPASVSVTPASATVISGQGTNFTANCVAAPTPVYYWYDNNNQLIQSGTSSTLALSNLQLANGGTYTVMASNYLGTASTTFAVAINVPPCVGQSPAGVLVNVGDPVSFSVVEGDCAVPAPTYQWLKNGAAIPGATATSYSIGSVALSDIANYSVVISNAAGAITSANAKLAIYSTTITATPTWPANNASGVCVDTYLRLAFNQTPTAGNAGRVRIYEASNPTTPVDTIDMSLNSTAGVQARSPFAGDAQAFNYYPVMTSGNTATIYPHSGVLAPGKTYYVLIEPGVIVDPSLAYFPGISSPAAWQFTTKTTGPAQGTNLAVAADGSGDFLTVQGAVDFIPLNNTTPTLINIRNGNYVEIVDIAFKHNVTFRGQSRTGTIVGYPNNFSIAPGGSSHARMAFKVYANDVAIENLTLSNSTPQGGSQAEALTIDTGARRFILNNANVFSRQDTILANVNSSQGYFCHSAIYGNYDYIWGGGNLFFDGCVIHTLTNTASSSYNLTAARTDFGASSSTGNWQTPDGTKWSSNGLSFVACTLEGDSGIPGVTLAGNNGTAGGQVDWIGCKIDANIYIGPSAAIGSSYNLWQYANTDLSGSPVSFSNVVALSGGDPRLLAATNIAAWLNGWQPQLAPNLLTNPVNQNVTGGGAIVLTAFATGIPVPAYQWFKDGIPLSGQTGATLQIAAAHAADAGSYSVTASNAAGIATSAAASVTVGNTAPALNFIPDQTVNAGMTVRVVPVASDPDLPLQTLTFSLVNPPPDGATFDTHTGAITWRPMVSQASASYLISVVVADSGTPSLSATQSFEVIVHPMTQPDLSAPFWNGAQFGLTVNGLAGPDYIVLASTNLLQWTPVYTNASPTLPFTWSDPDAGQFPARFYRIQPSP